MDRNLALEVVRVTEAAALASARLMGRGDRDAADRAAVEAMRQALGDIAMAGEVVIGQGERSQAPSLYTGEKVGRALAGDPEIEIAVDALEGTNLCATGAANAISVIAMAEKGKLLRAPDTYKEKIAVGPAADGAVDLSRPPRENLRRVADALGKYVEDLTVVILDRPRNERWVREVRETGARIKLIGDGDLAGALNTCFPETGVDVLMGIGGAPEGVISAAALRCVGGGFQGRFVFRDPEEKERARGMGITDPDKVFGIDDLADGHVMFAATGVTNGDFLKGVRFTGRGAVTHSVVMRSRTEVKTFDHRAHFFDVRPRTGPGGSQGALAGVEIAMCLFGRADKDPKYVEMAEEYLRRVEGRFIHWGEGGRVSEQTGYMPRIGFTGRGVAQAFGKAFEATGYPIYLAKALTLARPLIEEFAAQPQPDGKQGKYAWDHYSAPRAAINLLEMYQFLKKHNLPGGE